MSDDIVREFLVESSENLDLLDRELINLEKDPGNRATLASIFRTIHTIKGTCGFLGFTKLESVAHVGENLLSKLRDGELALNPEMTTVLLAMVDAIRQMLASVEAIGNEGERNDQELIQSLTRLLQGSAAAPKAEAKTRTEERTEDRNARAARSHSAAMAEAPSVPVDSVPVAPSPDPPVEPAAVVAAPLVADAAPKVEAKSEQHAEHPADHGPAPTADSGAPSQSRTAASESTIRVDVTLLDKLMNLVGELVLARNQILQFSNATEDAGLLAPSQRLNLITTELQEGVMKTRMQPIGNIWSKFPRTVRDVATMLRQASPHRDGRQRNRTRQDHHRSHQRSAHAHRSQLRRSRHRNARTPRRRRQSPPKAGCCLRAFHEGGQVNHRNLRRRRRPRRRKNPPQSRRKRFDHRRNRPRA